MRAAEPRRDPRSKLERSSLLPAHVLAAYAAAFALALTNSGCWPQSEKPQVVVYAALDAEFSEPILNDFAKETGVRALCNFDAESTKTVGLVNRIQGERQRPRCDVFWNNEILNTLRLQREGLLEAYASPAAVDFPTDYRSRDGQWTGLAARARVLIVNNKLVSAKDRPDSVDDLADSQWKGRCGIALPLFGTTATHAAVIFSRRGDEAAKEFFRQVHDNCLVLSGNKQVALAVGSGQLAWGITDTDDALIERDDGKDITIVFPDQGRDQSGALFIPNTVCLIRGGPNPREARVLIDYLLQPKVEDRLAEGASGQFPINPGAAKRSRVGADHSVRWMEVDFEAAADKWDAAADFLRQTFRN